MTTLRVAGVPEPYNLPWHLAMEKGRFREADIDLQWHTVPEGSGRMCQMLRDGELDMAVLVTEAAVRDILNGGSHRIVSSFVGSALPWGVHVPARSALMNPADLRGVPFAISRMGSGSHIMAMVYAGRQGWQPRTEDLEVVHNMAGAAERMQAGPPVVFLWETYVTAQWVDAGIMRRVDELRAPWPGFVIVAGDACIRDRSAVIDNALDVVRRAVAAIVADPRTVGLVMGNAGFSEARAREWLTHVHWTVGRPDPRRLAPLADTLGQLSLVPRQASWEGVLAD